MQFADRQKKNADMGQGGVKKTEIMTTSFMNGPKVCNSINRLDSNCKPEIIDCHFV